MKYLGFKFIEYVMFEFASGEIATPKEKLSTRVRIPAKLVTDTVSKGMDI